MSYTQDLVNPSTGQRITLEHTRTNGNDNYISTADTIAKMRGLVYESLSSLIVVQTAQDVLAKIGKPAITLTEQDIIRGCFWHVKHKIHYVADEDVMKTMLGITDLEDGKDLLLSPTFLLQMPQPTGDCDDFSTLLAALLKVMGIPQIFFCTVAADDMVPDIFTHVYVKVQTADGLIPLDCSHGQYPGWEYKPTFKEQLWAV